MFSRFVTLLILVFTFTSGFSSAQIFNVGDITGEAFKMKTEAVNIHYEVFGEGDPLLVLHGNGGSTKSVYNMLPELIQEYQVIAVDSRCHGKSSCPETELTYELMADDISRVMDELGHKEYKIWGHSDGGIIGLILGYTHPDMIDKMLISGANTRPDSSALKPKIVGFINRYNEINMPLLRKQIKLMAHHPNISMENIRNINVPVTLLVGDRDAVRIEHTIELFRTIPQANLCILPGSSHFIENPEPLVYQIRQLKQPFSSPSTVKKAEIMAKKLFPSEN